MPAGPVLCRVAIVIAQLTNVLVYVLAVAVMCLQDFKVLYPTLTDYDVRYYIFLLLKALDYRCAPLNCSTT